MISALATIFGNVVYASGNDTYGAAKQLVYNDYSSTDGQTTGMKVFNQNNPISSLFRR